MFAQSSRSRRRLQVSVAAAGFALLAAIVEPVAQAVPERSHPTAGEAGSARSAAAPRVAAPATGSVLWKPCRDGFQCASVRVPLDYDNPAGAKIALTVIRHPAAKPSERIGSLMVNPGGPGGSGVDIVRGIAQFLPLELRSRFDIVGFDPRGVLRSSPVRCFNTADELYKALPNFAFPYTPAEEVVQHRYVNTMGAACARHAGAILAHMSTADAARDMDFLRAALGDAKMNYLGFSYGSVLGQTYANLFPSKVRALVIDGVDDPRTWVGLGAAGKTVPIGARLRSDVSAQKTLNEFFRLCDQSGATGCAVAPNSARRFAVLAGRLRVHPIEVPGWGKLTYADFVSITLGAMYATWTWPLLAGLMTDLEQGKPAALGRDLTALRSRLGVSARPQEQYDNYVEASPAVACSDSNNPASFTAWTSTAARSDRLHGYFGRPWTWAWSECATWPKTAGQDRYVGPWTARTARPVLVVGNYFDPATRYGGALAAAQLLPRSRLLTYAGWGHTAYMGVGNFCVDSTVTRYLVKVRLPAAGKVCRPEGSPFGPEPAAAIADGAAQVITGSSLPTVVRRALTPR